MKLIRAFLSPSLGGAVLLGITAATVAAAPSDRKESITTPIFNADSNSYFQLFQHSRRGGAFSWKQANAKAIRKFHRGQRGRLALVRDSKILAFVRANFAFEGDVWIGVRFF